MTLWEQISINFAVLINLLVAFFYPFSDGPGGKRLLEIISVDCQIVFPLLSAFYCAVHLARACPPLSRAHPLSRFPYFLFSFLARIGYLVFHISFFVTRAHRLSRVPYQALAFASVKDH